MAFQLVNASDDEIVIWQVEHGHIFGFRVVPQSDDVVQAWCKDIDGATEPAAHFTADARLFAREEARSRQLIA